ncbi:MAG: DUF2490 domain-containing protein [Saprospiraceae bacterium]|nr:DUF2490 domain-containing protein [Saprospiraceae bacterium]
MTAIRTLLPKSIGIHKFFILLISIFTVQMVLGQSRQVTREHQQWLQLDGLTRLSERWSLLYAAGYRWKDGFQAPAQYIIRSATQIHFSNHFLVGGGFGISGTYANGRVNRIEYRPYQDLSLKNTWGKVDLTHRYRIEERFFQYRDTGKITPDEKLMVRLRYALNLTIPLFKIGPKESEKRILWKAGDEVFFNTEKNTGYDIFGQNRILFGPVYQASKNLLFSLSWNSQFSTTTTPGLFRHKDAIWLQVRHQVDLRT